MAGILDSKSRIMDTLILPTGKAQAFDGHMQFRYVTITDRHAFYEATGSNRLGNPIATDASDRIQFEAVNRSQDLLCPEVDLNSKIMWPEHQLFQDSIVGVTAMGEPMTYGGVFLTNSDTDLEILKSKLPMQVSQAITASYDQQHFIASIDPVFQANDFRLSKYQLELDGALAGRTKSWAHHVPNKHMSMLQDLPGTPPVHYDRAFMHMSNFHFLPPVNKLPPHASIGRIMPWIVSNIDLKSFSYQDYLAAMSNGDIQGPVKMIISLFIIIMSMKFPGYSGLESVKTAQDIANILHEVTAHAGGGALANLNLEGMLGMTPEEISDGIGLLNAMLASAVTQLAGNMELEGGLSGLLSAFGMDWTDDMQVELEEAETAAEAGDPDAQQLLLQIDAMFGGGDDTSTSGIFDTTGGDGKELSLGEIDFAIAQSCFMGVYDIDLWQDVGSDVVMGYQTTRPTSIQGLLDNYHRSSPNNVLHGVTNFGLTWDAFNFEETTRDNNVIIQLFEFRFDAAGPNPAGKLTVVPGGTLPDRDSAKPSADLYHFGKIFIDDVNDQPHFVKYFSLLLTGGKTKGDEYIGVDLTDVSPF